MIKDKFPNAVEPETNDSIKVRLKRISKMSANEMRHVLEVVLKICDKKEESISTRECYAKGLYDGSNITKSLIEEFICEEHDVV